MKKYLAIAFIVTLFFACSDTATVEPVNKACLVVAKDANAACLTMGDQTFTDTSCDSLAVAKGLKTPLALLGTPVITAEESCPTSKMNCAITDTTTTPPQSVVVHLYESTVIYSGFICPK